MTTLREVILQVRLLEEQISLCNWLSAQLRDMREQARGSLLKIGDNTITVESLLQVMGDLQDVADAKQLQLQGLMAKPVPEPKGVVEDDL